MDKQKISLLKRFSHQIMGHGDIFEKVKPSWENEGQKVKI